MKITSDSTSFTVEYTSEEWEIINSLDERVRWNVLHGLVSLREVLDSIKHD